MEADERDLAAHPRHVTDRPRARAWLPVHSNVTSAPTPPVSSGDHVGQRLRRHIDRPGRAQLPGALERVGRGVGHDDVAARPRSCDELAARDRP